MGELDCNIKVLQFSSPSPQSPPARGGEVTIECSNKFVVDPIKSIALTPPSKRFILSLSNALESICLA